MDKKAWSWQEVNEKLAGIVTINKRNRSPDAKNEEHKGSEVSGAIPKRFALDKNKGHDLTPSTASNRVPNQ